jgi:hypothetical protein
MNTIQTTIETITPEVAKQYLSTNLKHQRKVTNTHKWHLRQQMQSGQWKMTGEPIIFDEYGQLVDGQHRLHALIEAKISLQFVIIRGVATDTFVAMNRGKSRSSADIMTIHGVLNSALTASMLANVINYRRAMAANDGKRGSLNSYIRASSTDIVEEYDKRKDIYAHCATLAGRCKKIIQPSIPATVSALAILDAGHSLPFVDHFWDSFQKGVGLSEGDPVLTLRNRISENARSKAKLSATMLMMIAIKAWNAYAQSKPMKMIRVIEGEPCPEIK